MKGASRKLLALLAVTLLSYGAFGAYVLSRHTTLDFFSYYAAASLVSTGQGSQMYDSSSEAWVSASQGIGLDPAASDPKYQGYPPYIYPPTFSLLLVPLTLAPASWAAGLWFFSGFVLLGLSVWAVLRAWRVPPASETAIVLTLSGLWLAPFAVTLYAGQVNLLVFFLLAVAVSGLRAGRSWTVGAAVGVAAAIKVFPAALLAYFLWKRQWKALLAGLVGGAAFLALALPVVGLGPFQTYFSRVLPGLSMGMVAYPPNQSISGFVARLGLTEGAPLALALATVVVVLLTALACTRKERPSSAQSLEFSAVLVGALLVSTISWEHYLVLLAIPVWLLVLERPGLLPFLRPSGASAPRRWQRSGVLAVLGLSYVLVNIQALAWHWLSAYPLLLSLGFYGTILLWLVLVGNLLGRKRGCGIFSISPPHTSQSEGAR